MDFYKLKKATSNLTIPEQRKRWFKEFIKPFLVVCLGYSVMYLVRSNFKAAQPLMKEQLGITTTQLGYIGLGFSLSYGICRSFLGYFFDGKNTKKILSTLLTAAGVLAVLIGIVLAAGGSSLGFLIVLWTLNGLVQCTGGPNSYSVITRWTPTSKRGKYIGIFTISHNVGGALAGVFALWGANVFFRGNVYGMFIVPGVVAVVVGIVGLFFGKGDPQELGWDTPEKIFEEPIQREDAESVGMSKKEIFLKYILKNPFVWVICISNLFVYVLRIGIDNWAPLYVSETLNFSAEAAVNTIMFFEIGGFIGNLLWGSLSDKLKGRRAIVAVVCLIGFAFAMAGYRFGTTETMINVSLLGLGIFIYGPILLTGLSIMSFVPKEAITVASALPGTFGYIFGDSMAKVVIAMISDPESNGIKFFGYHLHGWADSFKVFYFAIACAIVCFLYIAYGEEKKIRQQYKFEHMGDK